MNRLLRFDGRVAVVTGGGGGLGKAYALLLAERGASVVVNDLGGSTSGEGSSSNGADKVVQEIISKGGKAIPNYDSVTNGGNIIKAAFEKYGRIDILINNAGILRDKTFAKMSQTDWDLIQNVHVQGAYQTTRAAWDIFRNQKYGRIIMTSSMSGLIGNFGQANYSTAKAGLVGLAQTLAREGQKFNVFTNAIVPMAGSRMTEYILPPDLHAALKPELIAPVVAWLCHEDCQENGSIIEAAGGVAAKYQWLRSSGAVLRSRLDEDVTIEAVRDKWDDVVNMDKLKGDLPTAPEQVVGHIMRGLEQTQQGSSDPPSRTNMTNIKIPSSKFSYQVKDAILYALGVGMSTRDPQGLNFLYENSEDFRVLPTLCVIGGQRAVETVLTNLPGLNIDMTQILHGEQYVELHRPLPQEGDVIVKPTLVDVLDKISGAVYIIRVEGEDKDGPLFTLEYSIFEVGAGKFGGRRETSQQITRPLTPPRRQADHVLEYQTGTDQAALYRLSGDWNPLHIDPNFAAMGGFQRPILHGLCSFGIAARLILQQYGNGDPRNFKSIKARFSKPFYPGETLIVESWIDESRVYFEVKSKESGVTGITGGYVDLNMPARIRAVSKL